MRRTSPWRALHNRNFSWFLIGHGLSLCGSWMQSLALAWLVYRLTGSPFLLGLVEFLARFPILVFGVLGGAIADRYPRRRLLLVTHSLVLLQASALGILTLTDTISIGWILGLSCLLGLIYVFEIPARQALLIDLVPRADIPSAIGMHSSLFNVTRVIGPSVAGFVVAIYGEGVCFLLNAASCLVIFGCVAVIPVDPRPQFTHHKTWGLMAEGLRYAWDTPHVRILLTLATVLSIVALPFTTLLPVFAVDVLHGGPGSLGILMAATGLGALAGALYLARRPTLKGLDLAIGRSVLCFGIGLFALAASPTMWLTVPALLVIGFGLVSSLAGANTLLQSLAPDHLRGRVVSLYVTMSLGMTIFGSLLAGTGATYFGAPLTVAAGATFTLGASLTFLRAVPAIRRHIGRIRFVSREELPAA